MKIERAIKKEVIKNIKESNKISVIYGPRQVGKTTLSEDVIAELNFKTLKINADQEKYIDVLSSRDVDKMRTLVAGYDLLFIDEAQRVPDIGINLKILHDELPSLKIIATGSSSFELANKIHEPLTGRIWTYRLFPLSFHELSAYHNDFELNNFLENALVYGSYPEVWLSENIKSKERQLYEISHSYLYKDMLDLQDVRQSAKIKDLLKLLAFQVGSEVSLSELAGKLGVSRETVGRYIDLLEKVFVIFRLSGFNRNLRKEISKMDKIFFYDLGIRNALIDNFKQLDDRADIGALWENFLIAERMKFLSYENINAGRYFWRTHTGAELDYVEERSAKLYGYELKYGSKRKKAPQAWTENYAGDFQLINRNNFLGFIKN
jgi:uncharacterized protein